MMVNRVFVILALAFGLATAAPRAGKTLNFRNLYVEPTGKPEPSPRIIGGQEATPHSIPWQVFLEVQGASEGWYCGGSLISQTAVLTAAHCVEGAKEAGVLLGAHNVNQHESTQVAVNSKNTVTHSGWNSETLVNDIGLIKLPTPVTLNSNIGLVQLPSNDNSNYAGSAAVVSGWGLTNGHGSQISYVLNKLNTQIISNSVCAQQFGDIIKSTMVCINGNQGTGTCEGDSGGPLTVNGVQVGVVSFGAQYCPRGYSSVFTRVSKYLSWIKSNM